MARTGRPAKPTGILKLTGGFRDDRHGKRADVAATPLADLPACPTWMSDSARSRWNEIGPYLVGMNVMLDRYSPSLASLADSYADFIATAEAASRCPLYVDTALGGCKEHPIWNQKDKAFKRLMLCLREHGLTPASANGVQGRTEEKKSGLSQFQLKRA